MLLTYMLGFKINLINFLFCISKPVSRYFLLKVEYINILQH